MPKKKDNVSKISEFQEDVKKSTEAGEDIPQQAGGPGDIDSSDGPSNTRGFRGTAEAIQDIEDEQAKIDVIMDVAKKKCAPHRVEIAKVKKEAKEEFGVDAKAINFQVSKRKEERRRTTMYEEKTPEVQYDIDQLTGQFRMFDKEAA